MTHLIFIRGYLIFILITLLLISFLSVSDLTAQPDYYQLGKESWKNKDYQNAFNYLLEFRSQPYGRLPEVDYMIGTSACRIPSEGDRGIGILDWMLYAYPLSQYNRDLVLTEIDNCQELQKPISDVDNISREISAGMFARGKTFYWIDRDVPVNSYPARFKEKVDRSEFRNRLILRNQPDQAQSTILARFPNAKVLVSPRFVMVSLSSHTQNQLESISGTLEAFMDFLKNKYDLSEHQYFLTIYLVPDIGQLRNLAAELHHLDVSPATIGYSFIDDLSVVAVIPGMVFGTVLHELFHLTVRRDFGDIPQWLDEGMASLYEVTRKEGADFIGTENWRGKVLKKLRHYKPDLRELVSSHWFPYDLPSVYRDETADKDAVLKQAALTAMGRYFILYLQNQDKLNEVFQTFKDSSFYSFEDNIQDYTITLLAQGYDSPFKEIEDSFEEWLEGVLAKIPD